MGHDQFIAPKIKQLNTLMEQAVGNAQQEITGTQHFLLGYLFRHRDQALRPCDLEVAFSLARPTVSGILRRLEDKGYVRMEQDEKDRRSKRIYLTQKAVESYAALHLAIHRSEAQAVQGFTEEERALFSQLLVRAIRNMGAEPCQIPVKEETVR